MRLKIAMLKLLLRILGFLGGDRFKYSREIEGDFRLMGLDEKLWWGYKALIRQVENAQKGKGIEEYFKSQDLVFEAGGDFVAESRVLLTAGGDLSCSEVISPGSTICLWDDIRHFFFSADFVCANLESPLDSSRPVSVVPAVCLTAPDLNTSPGMFERYVEGGKGINLFSTANNHSLDQGESGLVATLEFLDSKGYTHVGTSRTPGEQMDIPVVEKNGIKLGFLSYTFGLNGYQPVPGKEYKTNVIRLNKRDADISLIEEHVRIAREKGADVIVAMLHWSLEFETYPIRNIIDMGHRIMECGVDVILGGHPHVAQPMEKYVFSDPHTGSAKEGFIVYSLGELVSYNAFSRNSRLTWTVKLEISKGTENGVVKTRITGLKVLPVYTLIRKLDNDEWDYRLLDFQKLLGSVKEGQNPYGFSPAAIKEQLRLEKLLCQKLLPANHQGLLAE